MKKLFLTLSVVLAVSLYSTAMAETKIAVVDVTAVVAKSNQVATLKKEHQKKISDLEKWLKSAREDVEKQQTKEGKEKLLKQYNSEFAKKKEAISKEYQTKLSAVDKSITSTIEAKAKELGYNMVISKGMVVCGGDDITAAVQKVVK